MLFFVKAALVKLPPELRLSSGMISLCAPLIQAAGWSFVNPIRAESVWETMSERVSEKEREKEGGGCVLKQGISVFQLLSGWFPERTILSLSLFAHIDQAQTFFLLSSMTHLRMGLSRMRFTSPFCFLSISCSTSLVPPLQFQASARFKAPPCQLTVSQFAWVASEWGSFYGRLTLNPGMIKIHKLNFY